jgi:hypothetical protein
MRSIFSIFGGLAKSSSLFAIQGRGYSSGEMRLPAGFVGKRFENPERRPSHPDRKPANRGRFLLDEPEPIAWEFLDLRLRSRPRIQLNE